MLSVLINYLLCSPHRSPYVCYGANCENLHKHQDILSLVITFFFMSTMFDEVMIL